MSTDYEDTEAGLTLIAQSIRYLARELGTNNAATPMGAMEIMAMETKAGSERIADALIAVAVALDGIAEVLAERKK